MKSVLRSLAWAAAGVLAYLFLPDLLRAVADWPWGKILQIAAFVVPAVTLLTGLIGACLHFIEVGSAIIRIADKIAPREDSK